MSSVYCITPTLNTLQKSVVLRCHFQPTGNIINNDDDDDDNNNNNNNNNNGNGHPYSISVRDRHCNNRGMAM
jgi:hypothetical protein